ncbi:MAG: ATPase [Bacteroidales bacterium]
MKLIADTGSTKTNWYLLANASADSTQCATAGINPFFQTPADIINTLEDEFTLDKHRVTVIYYYGAGITNQSKKDQLYDVLHRFFGIDEIHIESDLMAAARSLCGDKEGIAAILGTGSNSCYFDGRTIVHNVSPLGYILGDEGSGAVLGRTLVSDILKNQFPKHLSDLFFETYQTTHSEVMEHVYRKPFPNRYLAQFTTFLLDHIHQEKIKELVTENFIRFFNRNIAQYPQSSRLPVHFTGSIAWHFAPMVKEAAAQTGYTTGRITQSPMQDLLDYHK